MFLCLNASAASELQTVGSYAPRSEFYNFAAACLFVHEKEAAEDRQGALYMQPSKQDVWLSIVRANCEAMNFACCFAALCTSRAGHIRSLSACPVLYLRNSVSFTPHPCPVQRGLAEVRLSPPVRTC